MTEKDESVKVILNILKEQEVKNEDTSTVENVEDTTSDSDNSSNDSSNEESSEKLQLILKMKKFSNYN